MKMMKKIFRLLMLPVVLAFFAACDTSISAPRDGYEYNFINQTSFTIYVTLDQGYALAKGVKNEDGTRTEAPRYDRSRPISISSNQQTRAYVDSKNVSFQWSTSNGSDNIYVYTGQEGASVTFKERAK